MDKDLLEFLELQGIRKNLTVRNLVKYNLKFSLYFLALGIYYVALGIGKIKGSLFEFSSSYGILKNCNRCVFGKSRETLIIISGNGYSRNDKVLQIMNLDKKNYTNKGRCIGYSKCGKCLEVINNKDKSKPCKFI